MVLIVRTNHPAIRSPSHPIPLDTCSTNTVYSKQPYPNPFILSPPKPYLVLRDTLCSCEGYRMGPRHKENTQPCTLDRGEAHTHNEVDDAGVSLDNARDVQQAGQGVDNVQKHLGGLGGGSDARVLGRTTGYRDTGAGRGRGRGETSSVKRLTCCPGRLYAFVTRFQHAPPTARAWCLCNKVTLTCRMAVSRAMTSSPSSW
jgi:hypothetical protein